MLPFHKSFFIGLTLFLSSGVFAQQDDVFLSVQQGHSDDILLVDVSDDGRFIASYGRDQKLIIWDAKSGNQLLFIYTLPNIERIKFDANELILLMASSDKLYELDIQKNEISISTKKVNNPQLKIETEIGQLEIKNARITLYEKVSNRKIKTQTASYFDQPFNSVIYSKIQKKVFVACKDGNIYVYDNQLKFIQFYKGHLSDVNDLALSSDEKFLFSSSSDRSIIQWDLEENKPLRRFAGRSYMTDGVSLNGAGTTLLFGDEIGFLKSIMLDQASLEISSSRKSIYPISFSAQLGSGKTIYAGDENTLFINGDKKSSRKIKAVKLSPRLLAHKTIVDGFGMYKPFYSSFYDVEISENEKWVIYLCDINGKYFPYYRIVNLENKKKSTKLYHTGHYNLNEPKFLNDSTFFTLDTQPINQEVTSEKNAESNAIMFWKTRNENLDEIYQKRIALDSSVVFANKLNENKIVLITAKGSVLIMDTRSNHISIENFSGIRSCYYLQKNVSVLCDDENRFHIVEYVDDKLIEKGILIGHQDYISSCAYDEERNRLFSTSKDATIRIWDLNTFQLIVTIIPIGAENAIYVTPDNYYMTTSKDLNSFGFRVGEKYFYPEQFDPVFNRPDIVLTRLGYVDSTLISAYHQAYLKRIEKLGFTEEMLKTDFHLPVVDIMNLTDLNLSTNENEIELKLAMNDTKYPLDRINVWINDVAIFGTKGISLRERNLYSLDTLLKIPLALGNNKIQVSVLNQAGAESYKTTTLVECNSGKEKPNLYLISIGCSNFKNPTYNLNYAAKDAEDIITTFGENKIYGEIFSKKLVNEEVTLQNILSLALFLKPADINDEVILFFAGHGVLDQKLDYYLASYDMDFLNPADKGIPYDAIEDLVDGIAPLKKIIFIDACHSGELDKREIEFSDSSEVEDGDLTFRKVGNSLQQKENSLGLQSTSQLTKSLFADLRKGTGATVISSAGGMELAIESNEWKNGLFTYCLLEGIKSKNADLNHDGKIMLSEIQIYVGEQVMKLSNGRQQPTSRIENNSLDYRVW